MVMVQDPEEAEYDSMPSHAIRTGLADIVLPVEKMPPELMKYKEHPFFYSMTVDAAIRLFTEAAAYEEYVTPSSFLAGYRL